LDVYGGTPEFERNLEAARMLGAEIEKAVAKVEKAAENADSVFLFANKGNGSGAEISQAVESIS